MRKSTRGFLAGTVLVAVGAGLYWWGLKTDLQPAGNMTKADVMAVIGRYAGGLAGAGIAGWIVALILRLRGK